MAGPETKRPVVVGITERQEAPRPSLKKQFLKLLGLLHPHPMRIRMTKTKMFRMAVTERPMHHLLKERKRRLDGPRAGRLPGHPRGRHRHGHLRGKRRNVKLLNESQRFVTFGVLYLTFHSNLSLCIFLGVISSSTCHQSRARNLDQEIRGNFTNFSNEKQS